MSPTFSAYIHHDVYNSHILNIFGTYWVSKAPQLKAVQPTQLSLKRLTLCSYAGLSPPSATLRRANLGSLVSALCVRTMRFLHLTERLPYQGLTLFVGSIMSKNVCRAPVCQTPFGDPFAVCWFLM